MEIVYVGLNLGSSSFQQVAIKTDGFNLKGNVVKEDTLLFLISLLVIVILGSW
jgi:hypothetical protein